MADITNCKVLYLKAALFLLAGMLASALLILQHPALGTIALLSVAVWGFARAYYFAFYVVEHYVDPGYRFSGLGSFVLYLVGKRGHAPETERPGGQERPGS